MTDDELMLFEEMAAARGLGILAQRLILDYNRRGAEIDRLRELNAELVASRAELEQCGKDDDETIRGLIESQNRVAEVVAQQRAEIDHLRALNAELVRKIDSACMTLGLGLGDLLPGQQSVGAREWREIAERAYQTLKADTKPEPKA